MKKKLTLLILFLFVSNTSYSEETVKLPKDTSSGYKRLFKSLDYGQYKDYGMQVVDIKDGHPVRSGKQSVRFEVRSGDCEKNYYDDSEWSDCDNDRERHELSGGGDTMSEGEYWFSWSIYFPEDHINLYPLFNNYGQFHQKGGAPVFMFKEDNHGYTLLRTIDDNDHDEKVLINKTKMLGNWFDILINAKWTKKENGFFKVWVNDKLKYDYKGATMSAKSVYYKFGIYRTGISRYINYKNLDAIWGCFKEKGYTTEENTALFTLNKKKIGHKISMQIYKKCKDYYKHTEVPTTIVYFDEVRKGKSKESVIKNLSPLSN